MLIMKKSGRLNDASNGCHCDRGAVGNVVQSFKDLMLDEKDQQQQQPQPSVAMTTRPRSKPGGDRSHEYVPSEIWTKTSQCEP